MVSLERRNDSFLNSFKSLVIFGQSEILTAIVSPSPVGSRVALQ
jgi:hypothetical protein